MRIEGGNYCFGGGFCRRNARNLENNDDCPFFDVATLIESSSSSGNTKIAICSSGQTPDSLIADHFGRSSYFLIYDPGAQTFNVFSHKGKEAGYGAGANAARRLLSEGVGIIIAKQIGPRSFAAMQHLGIDVYTISDINTVEETLEKYSNHQLEQLFNSNSNQ
ncbi:MAG: NifB/NifX family molybdenum-iron cluster-binding protein [Bacillota bacterium]|nr:NifB/NifX family molybdenum-iron cluster-binding protein [Bacillota bacterium]